MTKPDKDKLKKDLIRIINLHKKMYSNAEMLSSDLVAIVEKYEENKK